MGGWGRVGMHWEGKVPPPPPAPCANPPPPARPFQGAQPMPSQCPLTASAGFNGIYHRQ